jgi:hypothetical protein
MIAPEELYQRVGTLLTNAPHFDERSGALFPQEDQWLGAAIAAIEMSNSLAPNSDPEEIKEAKTAVKVVVGHTTDVDLRAAGARQLMSLLRRALARLELIVPTAVVGAFVPAGDVYEAHKAVGDVLRTANDTVLLVDPCADDSLLSAYAVLAPEAVTVRILTDEKRFKPSLKPAYDMWKQQYKDTRPLDVRLSANLHDRLIIVDMKEAWTVGQSFKDLAIRQPTTISRTPQEIAELKIKTYETIWGDAYAMA